MLTQEIVEKLVIELKMAPLNIIRENLEMEILNELDKQDMAKNLIFYGGTALRLAYNSARFSEDLDFLLTKQSAADASQLRKALRAVADNNAGVTMEEVRNKKMTLFGLLHIIHPLLKHPMRIKIEICKKKNGVKKENRLLISPTTNLEVIFPTADLDSIYKTKLAALKNRGLPRDWFDIWYLNHKLGQAKQIKRKFQFNKLQFTNELKRFLPQTTWQVIPSVIKYYE